MDLYHNILDLGFCVSEHTRDDLLIHRFKADVHVELEMIKEMLKLSDPIFHRTNQYLPSLSVLSEGVTLSKEAREFGSTEAANRYICASAVVINSLPHRIVGNFIVKVQKPVIPFKLFNDQDQAIKWLRTFDTSVPGLRTEQLIH